MGHDQLFKQLFQSFFGDMMTLVCPEVASELDLEAADFLSEEHFTDLPTGERRTVDLLARVPTRADEDGQGYEPEAVLVHVEVELQARTEVVERMRRYGQQIQLRHGLPVIPIVVYLNGGLPGVTRQVLDEEVFDLKLTNYRYLAFGLSRSEASEYLERPEPLAWALASLMKPGNRTPTEHKLACLRRIAGVELDPARRYLLLNCVETYLELSDRDQEEMETMLVETMTQEDFETQLTWGEKKELGGLKEALICLLREKFGPLSTGVRERVEALDRTDAIFPLLKRILTAESLEELGLGS